MCRFAPCLVLCSLPFPSVVLRFIPSRSLLGTELHCTIDVPKTMTERPTAEEALGHPWILSGLSYSDEELWYPPDEDNAVLHDDHDRAGDEECDGGAGGVVIEEYVGVGGIAVVEAEAEGEGGVVSPRRRSV